jgi:hypothetical protein
MTRIAIAMTLAVAAMAQTPPPVNDQPASVKGSIAGVVRDAGTGAPISGATVAAIPVEPDFSVGRASQAKRVSAVSDSEGRYTLRGVESGKLRVNAQGLGPGGTPGFGPSASKFVSLSPGQELAALDLHLRTLAQISGKVFDENKEPVPGIAVFLVAREYYRGALRHVLAAMSTTDDQGAYTLNRVTTGRAYLVLAEKRTFEMPAISPAPAELRLRRPAVVPTYYPGSKFAEGTEALVLRVGEHRENIDIRLLRAPAYCVEGTLDGTRGPAALRFEIIPRQPTSGTSGNGGFYVRQPGGVAGPDGKIRICDLAPGDYTLFAFEAPIGMTGPAFFGTTPVTIVDNDVRRVSAPAGPHVSVPGEVVWDGTPPDQPIESKLTLLAEPIGRGRYSGESLDASPTIPGQFSFPEMLIGPLMLQVRNLPSGLYLKDVTYNDRSILYEPLNVGSAMGPASLRVILARDGGTVSVKVADKDNKPVSDAYIALGPMSASSEAVLADAMLRGQTDQLGAWTSRSLAPGKYFVVASNAEFDLSPESVGRVWRARTLAQEIDLAPKGKASVTVEPKILN